jgi:hypothetical protein
MKRIRSFLYFILAIVIFLFSSRDTQAFEDNQFINIVNPVRISRYNAKPGESLSAQYSVISKYNLSATWLLTFDAISDSRVGSVVRGMDSKQEFGIFLEISPSFAKDSGVEYHNTGYWHHATSVFLSGYTQEERIKMIDKVFESFKNMFGYYPKSVGAWWIDAYSLKYMKDKYDITSALGCSDQYSTDGYQLWGQPWMVPYYPSINHAGVPATNINGKIDILKIQWAPRDPLWGYESSLFSTQDYSLAGKGLDLSYFNKLIRVYLQKGENDFGQVTVGLESDLDPEGYLKGFDDQMKVVLSVIDEGVAKAVTMGEFASWYRNKYPELSPVHRFEIQDLLGSNTSSIWYQSNLYRIFYERDLDANTLTIRDMRFYPDGIREPNFLSPNYENNLAINIPAVIDQIGSPERYWVLSGEAKIETYPEKIVITGSKIKLPDYLSANLLINISKSGDKVEIWQGEHNFPSDDLVVRDYSSEARHFFKQKRFIIDLLMGRGWNYFKKVEYVVPQEELFALAFLHSLPSGEVLVYDNECLQCSYHTTLKPLFVSGSKSYVSRLGGHGIKYNRSIFEAKTREEARNEFERSGVRYVYLVKFEGYKELLPFSPGDLGVEMIFSNANAEVWRAKSDVE